MELPNNPLEVTLHILDSRWKVLIIRELFAQDKRFNELKKDIKGISQKILSAKLKELEQAGFVRRIFQNNITRYSITDVGLTLKPVLVEMTNWGRDFKRYNKLLSR